MMTTVVKSCGDGPGDRKLNLQMAEDDGEMIEHDPGMDPANLACPHHRC